MDWIWILILIIVVVAVVLTIGPLVVPLLKAFWDFVQSLESLGLLI